MGHVMLFCGEKVLNTQLSVGACTHKSPIMKWTNALKDSSKKITETKHSLSHNANQCNDTDGFLDKHSPSKGKLYHKGHTLQKIIVLFFFLVPLILI